MDLPILQKLKDGERFDFATLADNTEQTDEYWDWWWQSADRESELVRPEIIADDDPILTPTCKKDVVEHWELVEFFDKTLRNLVKSGAIPCKHRSSRSELRDHVQRIVFGSSTRLQDRPQLVFAGGGYGSGKTFALNYLAEEGCLPVETRHLVGVDIFKNLIPEYHLIKAVADGRASLTVQQECKELADVLFDRLVAAGNSFAWDSSMGNRDDAMRRIQLAKNAGYEITLIAVLTPYSQAVQQAMRRAFLTRRFPHPKALPESHRNFRLNFNDYVPLFDEVTVFANSRNHSDSPMVIARKSGEGKGLEVLDQALLESLLQHES
jgi:predicted ABC-type ATPase